MVYVSESFTQGDESYGITEFTGTTSSGQADDPDSTANDNAVIVNTISDNTVVNSGEVSEQISQQHHESAIAASNITTENIEQTTGEVLIPYDKNSELLDVHQQFEVDYVPSSQPVDVIAGDTFTIVGPSSSSEPAAPVLKPLTQVTTVEMPKIGKVRGFLPDELPEGLFFSQNEKNKTTKGRGRPRNWSSDPVCPVCNKRLHNHSNLAGTGCHQWNLREPFKLIFLP